MRALVLCCGGSYEPLDFSIKNYKTDYYYFLHSKDTLNIAQELVNDNNINDDQYSLKLVPNHESLEDSYAKSREVIRELQKEGYEITVDFTGGTKPMVGGLILAAIDENCTYIYVGSKTSEARDKQGVGIVQNGFEELKTQRDPYDVYAVMEFNKGMDFFNRYQFIAAKTNFEEASIKLESKSLKELSELYLQLVDVYDRWDKFKNVKGKKLTLNNLLRQILDKINNSENLKSHLKENYPDFIPQIRNNIEFLDLKLSKEGKIKPKNVQYYLPDLLNNAWRRIEEGKYDDAVARLYRSIELIAQMCLSNENLINEQNLLNNSKFSINVLEVDKIMDFDVHETLETFDEYNKAKMYGNKTFKIALKNSYKLLESMGSEFASDYLNDEELNDNINLRNISILAHGLNPVDEDMAKELYSQVFAYAKKAFPDLVKYMDMANFPKFE